MDVSEIPFKRFKPKDDSKDTITTPVDFAEDTITPVDSGEDTITPVVAAEDTITPVDSAEESMKTEDVAIMPSVGVAEDSIKSGDVADVAEDCIKPDVADIAEDSIKPVVADVAEDSIKPVVTDVAEDSIKPVVTDVAEDSIKPIVVDDVAEDSIKPVVVDDVAEDSIKPVDVSAETIILNDAEDTTMSLDVSEESIKPAVSDFADDTIPPVDVSDDTIILDDAENTTMSVDASEESIKPVDDASKIIEVLEDIIKPVVVSDETIKPVDVLETGIKPANILENTIKPEDGLKDNITPSQVDSVVPKKSIEVKTPEEAGEMVEDKTITDVWVVMKAELGEKRFNDLNICQKEIEGLMQNEAQEILTVGRKYSRLRTPFYKKREVMVQQLPNFWYKVILNHHYMKELITEGEKVYLRYLTTFEIEDITTEDSGIHGYEMKFIFRENPYFENDIITKECVCIDDDESWKLGKTEVKWKFQNKKVYTKIPLTFFDWLTTEGIFAEEDPTSYTFKNDIWINPFVYYAPNSLENNS